jgi:hypothetical protein
MLTTTKRPTMTSSTPSSKTARHCRRITRDWGKTSAARSDLEVISTVATDDDRAGRTEAPRRSRDLLYEGMPQGREARRHAGYGQSGKPYPAAVPQVGRYRRSRGLSFAMFGTRFSELATTEKRRLTAFQYGVVERRYVFSLPRSGHRKMAHSSFTGDPACTGSLRRRRHRAPRPVPSRSRTPAFFSSPRTLLM